MFVLRRGNAWDLRLLSVRCEGNALKDPLGPLYYVRLF